MADRTRQARELAEETRAMHWPSGRARLHAADVLWLAARVDTLEAALRQMHRVARAALADAEPKEPQQ